MGLYLFILHIDIWGYICYDIIIKRTEDFNMTSFVETIDFGNVPIRRTHKSGAQIGWIELSGGGYAEIRTDYKSNQPFAVLFDEDLNEL